MAKIHQQLTELIGHTPLLELQKLAKELGGNLELAVKRIAEMRRERKMSNGKA